MFYNNINDVNVYEYILVFRDKKNKMNEFVLGY